MWTKWKVVYLKCCIWAGVPRYYVGDEPARPEADPCNRLGRYVYASDSIESARAYARCAGETIVEQEPYVGYVRMPCP